MELIFFLFGVLAGIILTRLFTNRDAIYGVIEIDHEDDSVKVHMTSEELRNRKKKRAVFKLDHDANFSRD